jgi:DNA-binding PadR family transcriptional regulator
MDERAVLLLGMLRLQSQHGYQLNEFIEQNLSRVTDMKKPTAYKLLDRLEQEGAIISHLEQEGNRPPRKVYAITEEGERLFFTLLRENLASFVPQVITGEAGFMFLDVLPRSEVVELLHRRLAALEAYLVQLDQVPPHTQGIGVDLAIERQHILMQADAHWLADVLQRLVSSEHQKPSRYRLNWHPEDSSQQQNTKETPARPER